MAAIDTGPPGNGKPPTRPRYRGLKRLLRRRCHKRRVSASSLTLGRYAQGLLVPFRCSACGAFALDPIGYQGKRRWLCEVCAEGDRR
jgi:hypothetical protein